MIELETDHSTPLSEQAIAVLLDLAQRGEIDPWDVQVIDVIDRYLSKIGLREDFSDDDQTANLAQSGQAFLWASMLVLLKANTLERLEEEEEAEEEFLEMETEAEWGRERALPIHLERHIRRRPSAPPPRRRRVTLQELIEQIQQMAAVLESAPPRSRSPRPRPHSRRMAAKAIAQLAHDENLTEMAGQLEAFLALHLPQLTTEQPWLELEQLVTHWRSQQPVPKPEQSHSPSSDRVGVFWALLLLSAQSKVELSQEEFYQDLKIRPLSS
ncbi:MAG: segregation/condensation protein A [Chroococcales cyanobacterium]